MTPYKAQPITVPADSGKCLRHGDNSCYLFPLSQSGIDHMTRQQRETVALANRLLEDVKTEIRAKLRRSVRHLSTEDISRAGG